MLNEVVAILASQSAWSAVFYLVAGAFLGALVCIYLTFKAQRPQLVISGNGSGSSANGMRWSLNISNRPMFFGLPFSGEAAKDVHAWLALRETGANMFPLSWQRDPVASSVTFEAGESGSLIMFAWQPGDRGYAIVDRAGEPVARFGARQSKFRLRLNDKLGRSTELNFTVNFDDSHLKQPPRLEFVTPLTVASRFAMARIALKQLRRAFSPRT